MRLCVKNGMIINPKAHFMGKGTIWIEENIIVCIETGSTISGQVPKWENPKTIDAAGKWVVPGLIDLHVHLREPGFEYKEDIASGANAAKKGGFTTICCMPNTNPVVDDEKTVLLIQEKAKHVSGVQVLPIGAITKGQLGEKLADIAGMAKQGICAVSEDGRSVMNARVMLEGMIMAKEMNLPVFSHTEDENLAGTAIGEELIVARDIMLAKEAGCRLHLCHISTKGSIDIIRRAKADGLPVTAETAPHYFTLDASQVSGNGNLKMNPPLRTTDDVKAIREALKDGTIDAIATDHAPHAREEKEVPLEKALNGVIGLETSFAVSYTMLVKTGILKPLELIRTMSTGPAEILGIDRGQISVGKPCDIALIDVSEEYEIKKEDFVSKSCNSPFIGMKVFGRAQAL